MSPSSAIFFDRDGTIIESEFFDGKPRAQNDVKKVVFIPESIETISLASNMGFKCFVVTNQPDVFDGIVKRESVESVNELIMQKTKIIDVQSCYLRSYNIDSADDCMKPSPRMILHLASKWNLVLSQSWFVGDQWKDIEAGRRAGCRTILIDRFYSKQDLCDPTHKVNTIGQIIDILENDI